MDLFSPKPTKILSSLSYKMMILSTLLFGTLNFNFYNAVLISHLTVGDEVSTIENLEDILANKNLQLIQFSGFASNTYFSSSTKNQTAKTIWLERIRDNPHAYVDSYEEAGRRLEESRNNVLLIPESMINRLHEMSPGIACELTASRASVFITNAAIPLQKGSQYLRVVKAVIERAYEAGVLDQVNKKLHLFGESREMPCATQTYNGPVEVCYKVIFTAFIIIAIGIACSLSYACIEKFQVTSTE